MSPFVVLKSEQLGTHFEQSQLLQAICFAADKHQNQRRKNKSRTPYINHPLQVMQVLWQIGQVYNHDILIAAVLHDTLEDTDATSLELSALFGIKITQIVEEVSDNTQLSSQERKYQQVKKVAGLSVAAQQIKLADKICNISDIASIKESPAGWNLNRKQAYLCWSTQVVEQITACNKALAQYFEQVLQQSCINLHISRENLCSTLLLAKIVTTV